MSAAYVDSSCVVAIAFGERGAAAIARRIGSFDEILASNLLEAELRAAFAREKLPLAPEYLGGISWVIPDRPLSREIERALGAGRVRGADLWHLATALFVAPDTAALTFLTLDQRQGEVAAALGFGR